MNSSFRQFFNSLAVLGLLGGSLGQAQDKSGSRAGLIKSPGISTSFSGETSQVGTSGNKGVNQFSVPLPSLPGRAGHAPSLSISYDQQGRNQGQGFGIGWSIQVPSIVVSTEVGLPFNGLLDNDNPKNPLLFEGEKLVFISSGSNKINFKVRAHEQDLIVTYHKKSYEIPFAYPIAGVGLPNDGEAGMASGFEVLYPNGTRQLYSSDLKIAEGFEINQITTVTKFPLVFEVSKTGEAIHYAYKNVDGRSYLSDVYFAGGKSHYSFELMATNNTLQHYNLAFPQKNSRIYTKMVAAFDGRPREQWCFVYLSDRNASTGKRAIRTHEDCIDTAKEELKAAAASESLSVQDELQLIYRYGKQEKYNPAAPHHSRLKFSYSAWDPAHRPKRRTVSSLASLISKVDFTADGYELADINHDGMVDAIHVKSNGQSEYFLGKGGRESFGEAQDWLIKLPDGRTVEPNLSSKAFHFADLNGDTYVDLLQWENKRGVVFLGQAAGGFTYSGSFKTTADDSLYADVFDGGNAQFVDLNGDGKSDVLTTTKVSGRTVWKVYVNRSRIVNNRWELSFVAATLRFPFPEQNVGLSDSNFRIADFNSDGLSDITYLKPSILDNQPGLCVYLNMGRLNQVKSSDVLFGTDEVDSTCGAGGAWIKLSGLDVGDYKDKFWLVDANGDGLVDVATIGKSSFELMVWFGQGGLVITPVAAKIKLTQEIQIGSGAKVRSRTADIDGDGQDEILIFNNGASGDQRVQAIDFNREVTSGVDDTEEQPFHLIRSNLLTAVEHDNGLRFDMRYTTASAERLRDSRLQQPVSPLHFPVYVLKQLIRSIQVPGKDSKQTEVQEFFYHQPQFSAEDREFLGFKQVGVLLYGETFGGSSSYTLTSYHTSAAEEAGRRLAGKPSLEVLKRTSNNVFFEKQGEDTRGFKGDDPRIHSLINYAADQSLPDGPIVRSSQWIWKSIPREGQLFFLRLVREATSHFDEELSVPGGVRQENSTEYGEFDTYNFPAVSVSIEGGIADAKGGDLPEYKTETRVTYNTSRDDLVEKGILDLPDSRKVIRNKAILTDENYLYNAAGLLKEKTEWVYSRHTGDFGALEAERIQKRKRLSSIEYDKYGSVTQVADGLGVVQNTHYDASGNYIERQVVPKASDAGSDLETAYTYKDGLLHTETNPRGLVKVHTYDDLGRIKSIESDGSLDTYSYREALGKNPLMVLHEVRKVKDSNSGGLSELAIYRADGQILAQLQDVQIDKRAAIRVKLLQDYDRKGRPIAIWTPFTLPEVEGRTVAQYMNTELRVLESSHENRETRSYDYLGRVKSVVTPQGKTLTTTYHPWGTETEILFQQRGKEIRSVEYAVENSMGVFAQITSYAEGSDREVFFRRDDLGQLSGIKRSGDAQERLATYNSIGQLESQDVPGIGKLYSLYDERGQQTALLRLASDGSKQHLVRWTYDYQGRMTQQTVDGEVRIANTYDKDPAGDNWSVHFKNQAGGLLGLLVETTTFDTGNKLFDRAERFRYDVQGKVVSREIKLGDKTYIEDTAYYVDGTPFQHRNPSGIVTEFEYDPAAQLEALTVQAKGQAQAQTIVGNIRFNEKAQLEGFDYLGLTQGKLQNRYAYDPKTLLPDHYETSLISATDTKSLQNIELVHDGNNQILEITDLRADKGAHNRKASYSYNGRNELISAETAAGKRAYDYEISGSFEEVRDLHMWDLDRSSVEHVELPVYEYDGFKQLKKGPGLSRLEFDGLGQLILVETSDYRLYFGYDHMGTRSYKSVVTKSDGSSKDYLFPTKSLTETPIGRESHTFLGATRISSLDETSGQRLYYLTDHQGSTQAVVNQTGELVEETAYSPYGSEVKPARDGVATRQLKVPYRYTGHYTDAEDELIYMGFRYYDPRLGRFISPDPKYLADPELCVARALECNLSIYALNNPVNFIDPNGLSAKSTADMTNALSGKTSTSTSTSSSWATKASGKAGPIQSVSAKAAEHKQQREPRTVYRWGKNENKALTLRPVDYKGKDNPALSFTTTPPAYGTQYHETTDVDLEAAGFSATFDGDHHVSVRPQGATMSEMKKWSQSYFSNSIEARPHQFTARIRLVTQHYTNGGGE
ncbi:MAG TPA: RHS repeat-associated core domain-containing protein [Oligoflexus sp.]|uniref:RHS repeat-associated core domain-containing protein n=1 Tax=Oligoflexus sp. TaxID=1971216 RepID=UPI002D59A439|nr:RHS repeat-associated core domain-containing protein [Oligoflexus sp.]HYX33283.1 RHS repeat-associated core domain-containing protein [Oligoflexus sp.]